MNVALFLVADETVRLARVHSWLLTMVHGDAMETAHRYIHIHNDLVEAYSFK